jgi:hypothetical protein
VVGGERHPSTYAIYYILSNGCDFQGQHGGAPLQDTTTHTLLPLTSQGTALDIRGVISQKSVENRKRAIQNSFRIHNCLSSPPP